MKPFKSIIAVALMALCGIATAQTTNTPPLPSEGGFLKDVGTFLASGSNFMVVPYGIVTSGTTHHDYGAGAALLYKISDYVAPGIRIDYLNNQFYQGSFTTQLQVPIHAMTNLTLIPFVLGGVAVPFGGGASDPGSVQGIAGTGLALRLDFLGKFGKHLDLVYDIEKWSATDGLEHRMGILYKFSF